MQLIQNGTQGGTAIATKQAAVGTPGYPYGGPPGSTPATDLDPDIFATVMAELVAIATVNGAALDPANNGQCLAAIIGLINQYFPAPDLLTGAATLLQNSNTQFVECSGGAAYTVTLPSPSANVKTSYRIWLNTGQTITFATPSGLFYGPSGNSGNTIALIAGVSAHYDIQADGYNWIISASLNMDASGYGYALTPPSGDTSTKIANMTALARAIGGAFAAAAGNVTASTAIGAAYNGQFINVGGSATTQTLQSAAFAAGQTAGFYAVNAFTLACTTGDIIGSAFSSTSIPVPAGEWCAVQWDGANWRLFSASPGMLGYALAAAYTLPARQVKITTSGNWTVPAGITTVWVSGCAGGAGGNTSFSGGAGQPAIKSPLSVTPGHVLALAIGAAGAGGTTISGGTGGGNTVVTDSTTSTVLLTLTGAAASGGGVSAGYPSGGALCAGSTLPGASGPFGGGGPAGGNSGGTNGGPAYGYGAGGGQSQSATGGNGAPGLLILEF